MADYAPNYTPRLKVHYISLGSAHTMIWRDARGVQSAAGLVAKCSAWLTAIADLLYEDWTVTGAEWAATDTDMFLPVTPPTSPEGTIELPSQTGQARCVAVSWCGRTAAGGKARFFTYGTGIFFDTQFAINQDFRSSATEVAAVGTGVAALNAGSPYLRGNDNAVVTWYPYINFKLNDYQVRKARRG